MTVPAPPGFSGSWYSFEPCCGGPIIYFSHDGTTNAPQQGISIYTGPPAIGYEPITGTYIPLVNNQCYKITRGVVSSTAAITVINYNNLNVVPSYTPSNYIWDSTTNYEDPCGAETPGFCPDCITQCYDLWSCDGSEIALTTDTDLSLYVNSSVLIQVDADSGFNCYYVTLSTSCINAVTVVVDPDIPCTDPC